MLRLLIILVLCAFISGCALNRFHVNYQELAKQLGAHDLGVSTFDSASPLLSKRTVLVSGPLNVAMVRSIVEAFAYLDEKSKTERITLLINSGGGDGTAYLAIANMIKSVKAPIDAVNISMCGSAALLVFLSATSKRYAMEGSAFVIHDVRGKPQDIKNMYSNRCAINTIAVYGASIFSCRKILKCY